MATKSVTTPTTSKSQSNLLQLLNDPPVSNKSKSDSVSGPLLGNTSLVGAKSSKTPTSISSSQQSSNSQLFKSAGGDTGSSAIPLTFNNSIAEVLAAAAAGKNKNQKDDSNALQGKPEVTITAKPVAKTTSSSSTLAKISSVSSNSDLPRIADVRSLAQSLWTEEELRRVVPKTNSTRTSTQVMNSPSPSGGISIQKSGKTSIPSTLSSINTSTGVSNISQIHPLMDMSKLLQSQAPGVAPHIVAQSTLPSATGGINKSAPSTSGLAKLAPKPPGPLPAHVRPVQLTKPSPVQGIQTVNKKSLNTVLDRLSGLKTTAGPTATTPSIAKTTSSLVQQLQAPPMNKTSSTSKTPATTVTTSSASAALNALANPFMSSFASGNQPMVGQPMVQYPAWAQQAQAQAQAAQAALLMAAGLPGLNQVQAAAAMQELMKMSLQQQQLTTPKPSESSPNSNSSRIRAPPPLTHMGRPPNSGASSGSKKQD